MKNPQFLTNAEHEYVGTEEKRGVNLGTPRDPLLINTIKTN